MRVLVLGLDGANMDLIKHWASEGKLPHFEKVLKGGSYGYLESTIPTITIPAWNCLSTGKNPAKIGCFSFIQKAYRSYNFRVYQSLVEKERDIWDILSEYGHKVFVFNAPNVLKAYKINGWMVAGVLCLSDKYLTYPENLREELYKMGYMRDISDIETLWGLSDRELSRKHKEITERQCNVVLKFLEWDWDFGFVVFTELDRVQHAFWRKKGIILRHYQNIDKHLGRILTKLEKNNEKFVLIIVSDHGFGKNERTFLLNEWLIKEGLLRVRRENSMLKSVLRIQKNEVVMKILKILWKFSVIRPLYLKIYKNAAKTHILWEKTKAFSYGTWGTIYINLKGREPQGVVNEEEYERLRDYIIEKLRKMSVKAYKREELYHGKYLYLAPDIIVQVDDYVNSISGVVGYGRLFKERFGGHHRRNNGTFIAYGNNIKENNIVNARIYDIAPTILHIFGLKIPNDMDGRVLKEIFEKGSDFARRADFVRRKTDEIAKIKDRLKNLSKKL